MKRVKFGLPWRGLSEKYGLCKPQLSASNMLFYFPLIFLLTANFGNGVTLNGSPLETVLYILSMFCEGFLEEMIFRGFLFNGASAFANEAAMPTDVRIITSVLIAVIAGAYAVYVGMRVKAKEKTRDKIRICYEIINRHKE